MMAPGRTRPGGRLRCGVTIAEAAVASVIVAVLLSMALTNAAAARAARGRMADRTRAQALAMDLMSEVLQQSYQDPTAPESGRAAWSAVSEYNGLLDAPPCTKGGSALPDAAGWTRAVGVQWVDPSTLAPTTTPNTGVRRITVQVLRGGLVLATVSAYRTAGWSDVSPQPTDSTGNHPPTASISAAPLTGRAGRLTVNFNGSASSDPDGDPLSYVWNFGDGAADASATSASHTYTAAGTYSATLTVYDGRGGVGVASVIVTVNP